MLSKGGIEWLKHFNRKWLCGKVSTWKIDNSTMRKIKKRKYTSSLFNGRMTSSFPMHSLLLFLSSSYILMLSIGGCIWRYQLAPTLVCCILKKANHTLKEVVIAWSNLETSYHQFNGWIVLFLRDKMPHYLCLVDIVSLMYAHDECILVSTLTRWCQLQRQVGQLYFEWRYQVMHI